MASKSGAAARTGDQAWDAAVHARVNQSFVDHIDRAAQETGLTRADWIRFVLKAGLEQHEANMTSLQEPEDGEDEAAPPGPAVDPIPAPDDPRYAERIEHDAREARKQIRANQRARRKGKTKVERLNPRECPHLPKDRLAGTCRRCGLPVARMLTNSRGGPFGGGRRMVP